MKVFGASLFNEKYVISVVVAFFVFYYGSYFNYGIDLDDEGFLLLNAENILSGRFPMADYFSYQPLGYFALAGFFKLFGNGLLTERLFLLLLLFSSVGFVYYIARKVLPYYWALLPAMMFGIAPGPWYKVFFIFHVLLGMATIVAYLEDKTRWRAFGIGIAIGLGLASRYSAGLLVLGTTFAVFAVTVLVAILQKDGGVASALWRVVYDSMMVVVGVVTVLGGVAAVYFAHGKLELLFINIEHYYRVGTTLSQIIDKSGVTTKFSVSNLFSQPSLEYYFYAAGLLVCLANLWRSLHDMVMRRQTSSTQMMLFAISLCGLGSMAYTYYFVWNSRMLSSFALVYVNYFVIACAFCGWFPQKLPGTSVVSVKDSWRWIGVSAIPLFLVIVSFSRVQNYSGAITTRMAQMASVEHEKLRGIFIYADQKDDIVRMMELTQGDPGAALVSMSESTTMSYLSGLDNPTYYRLFLAEFARQGEQLKAIETFRSNKIEYFVARRSQFLSGGGPSSDIERYAPMVKEFLVREYEIIPLGKRFVLLRRKGELHGAA